MMKTMYYEEKELKLLIEGYRGFYNSIQLINRGLLYRRWQRAKWGVEVVEEGIRVETILRRKEVLEKKAIIISLMLIDALRVVVEVYASVAKEVQTTFWKKLVK